MKGRSSTDTGLGRSDATADLRRRPVGDSGSRCAPGGLAERFAGSVGTFHPIVVFLMAMLAGLAAIAALSIGIGFLVTGVLEHAWGVGAADDASRSGSPRTVRRAGRRPR